jgi:HAD superfamily hydrolase (TIGR01490 family)
VIAVSWPSTAAFFDLDNTLVHGSALFPVARAMRACGFVSTADLLRGAWQQLTFRAAGERSGQVAAVRDRALALAAGVEVSSFVELVERTYDERLGRRIIGHVAALASDHLSRGDEVWIVTAAPVELARVVAHRLGLTGALGTVSEVADGRWTGRLVNGLLHGPGKSAAVRELAGSRGYELADCAAYSDSASDLPMLNAVGHPHAVNPDRKLRAAATRNGWPMHDFRTRRHARRLLPSVAAPALPDASSTAAALRPTGYAA